MHIPFAYYVAICGIIMKLKFVILNMTKGLL